MQSEIVETEGVVALRKLQNSEYKLWSTEEIEKSNLSSVSKEVLYFIAKENVFRNIPQLKEIIKRFKLHRAGSEVYELRNREMVFSITIPEIIVFYGFAYLGLRGGSFHPPPHLGWLGKYLGETRIGRRGGTLSWTEKLKSARSPRYNRHWIAMLEKDGSPCYLPLGLHIPKQ